MLARLVRRVKRPWGQTDSVLTRTQVSEGGQEIGRYRFWGLRRDDGDRDSGGACPDADDAGSTLLCNQIHRVNSGGLLARLLTLDRFVHGFGDVREHKRLT